MIETVRDDLNAKGLMPDYLKPRIENLNNTNTIEDQNIFLTYTENGIENVETDGNDEVFYYIGCEMMKFPDVVKANIEILQKAGVKFSTNLDKRACCGGPAYNIRDLETTKKFASRNKELIKNTGANVVVSDCPGCVLTLTKRYANIGVKIKTKVIHIVEYIANLIKEGKITPNNSVDSSKLTIHDPCLIARNLNDTTSIRTILKSIPGLEISEPILNKESVHCCGWSGTAHWADKELSTKEAANRVNELMETGAFDFVTACPLCELGLKYGIKEADKEKIRVLDVSEILVKSL